MKKILISCLFLFTLFVTTAQANAAVHYPKSISFVGVSDVRKGGALDMMQITLKEKTAQVAADKMKYDIGVAREIKSGGFVEYQILDVSTTNYADLEKNEFNYQVKIPNIFEKDDSTYVVFVKSYPEMNPDAEDFLVSKSFTIAPTETPTVLLENAAVVTNTGEAFGLQVGPTLYKTNKLPTHATSAEIVLSLKSNTATNLQGTLSFTKLRSNSFSEKDPIQFTIFKGENIKNLVLPTFDYEPGVYMGELVLTANDGVQVPEKIAFQYIIDGPIATMGQIKFNYNSGNLTEFEVPVFGKPRDMYTNGVVSTSTSSETYDTTFTFYGAAGQVIGTHKVDLDYRTSNKQILVYDLDWKKVTKVHVETRDAEGKIIYSTDQAVYIPLPERDLKNLLYGGLILCLGIAWFAISRKKGVLVLTALLTLLCVASYTFASWTPADASGNPVNFGSGDDQIYLTFNEDFPTAPISCSEDTDVFMKMVFLECQNRVRESATLGVSRISMLDARAKATAITYTIATSTCMTQVSPELIAFMKKRFGKEYKCGAGGHDSFLYTTNFIKIAAIKGPVAPNSNLYISINGSKNVRTEYAMPLAFSSCDRCSNVAGEQLNKNFSRHGRDYFFSSADNKLYFAPSGVLGASACAVDMCADTEVPEIVMPADKQWNISATDEYTKYSCQQNTDQNCTCSGRGLICVENGVTTTTADAAQCLPQAYCSVTKSADMTSATFNFAALNILGTATYNGGAQTETVTVPAGQTITLIRTVVDSFDGKTSTASCSATNSGGGATGTTTPGDPAGDPVCTIPGISGCPCIIGDNCPGDPNGVQPKITSLTATKIVEKGQACEFEWATEYFDACTMNGQSVQPAGTERINTDAGRNIVRTLTCSYVGDGTGSPITASKSATCLVRPTVVEE